MDSKESKLSITTSADGTKSSVEIMGTGKQHLFNLTILARDVCKTIGIPPEALCHILPALIHNYERTEMTKEVIVDMEAIKKGDVAP